MQYKEKIEIVRGLSKAIGLNRACADILQIVEDLDKKQFAKILDEINVALEKVLNLTLES